MRDLCCNNYSDFLILYMIAEQRFLSLTAIGMTAVQCVLQAVGDVAHNVPSCGRSGRGGKAVGPDGGTRSPKAYVRPYRMMLTTGCVGDGFPVPFFSGGCRHPPLRFN